jgi:predicted lipoprotein with Yx(FWY)xxD motif
VKRRRILPIAAWLAVFVSPVSHAQVAAAPSFLPPQGGGSGPSASDVTVSNVGTMDRALPPKRLVRSKTPPPPNAEKGDPSEVRVRDSALGKILVNQDGMTLYQAERLIGRQVSDTFCIGPCAQLWKPFVPAVGARPVGAWRIIQGASGPQWAYGPNPVFLYSGDRRPGELGGHEFDDVWRAIYYVPPPPAPRLLPPAVRTALVDSEYLLLGPSGVLFTYGAGKNDCGRNCTINPFAAGFASQRVGDWTVARVRDRPHWAYRGKPVFVAASKADVPAAADALHP